jgi:hypothetical protein
MSRGEYYAAGESTFDSLTRASPFAPEPVASLERWEIARVGGN